MGTREGSVESEGMEETVMRFKILDSCPSLSLLSIQKFTVILPIPSYSAWRNQGTEQDYMSKKTHSKTSGSN